MNDLLALNQSQEIELLCCIYEYFFWKTEQEKEKEETAKKSSRSVKDQQTPSNDNDEIIPDYLLYQSVLDVLYKKFSKYQNDFANTKITIQQRIPRLIKVLFIDLPKSQIKKKKKSRNVGEGYNGSNQRLKSKRKIDKENNLETPTAKKKSRINVGSPATDTNKTNQSDSTSTARDCNDKSNKIDDVKVTEISATLENYSRSLPTPEQKSTATSTSAGSNDGDAPAATSNFLSDSKSANKALSLFEKRFKDLEHFKAGNGHTRVPVGKTELGRWVNRIRSKKRLMDQGKSCDNPLTDEQIERLESLGFEWKVGPTVLSFEQRLEALAKFKKIEDHCDVPRFYENDPSLGQFVHSMRTKYARKSKCLTTERIKKLENLGFNWVVAKKKTFEERLEECRNYRRLHGHLKVPPLNRVPSHIETEEQRSFIRWVETQRLEYKKWKIGAKSLMNKSRVNKLNEIGLDWTYDDIVDYKPRPYIPRKPKAKETFDERVQQMKEVKEKVGSCNALQDFVKAGYTEQSQLYQWMKLQRKYWRLNKLSEEKVEKLKELDFDFRPRKHYAPFGSKKAAAAKAQKVKELKEQQNSNYEDHCQCEDNSIDDCSRNDDETASEPDNDETNESSIQLQNNGETSSAHGLFQGFGTDTCRL